MIAKETALHTGMESTGVDWKPIFNVMEGRFEIVLANAQRLKPNPPLFSRTEIFFVIFKRK
jgi:hypothetical protein